jgi:hypothetical protein
LVGQDEVTRTTRCLFSFVTRAHPSRPFYALRDTPKTALNFGWLVGHGEVTRTSRCLFSFVTRAQPSRPFYALWATPKTALNFGWSVGRSVCWSVGCSVGRSRGSHTNVTLPLQFLHLGLPFPTLLRPAGHPQNGLKFWSVGRSIGRSVGRSVTGKSHKRHAASSVSLSGLTLPDPSTPCRPPLKQP